jgi:hypothetical protein
MILTYSYESTIKTLGVLLRVHTYLLGGLLNGTSVCFRPSLLGARSSDRAAASILPTHLHPLEGKAGRGVSILSIIRA